MSVLDEFFETMNQAWYSEGERIIAEMFGSDDPADFDPNVDKPDVYAIRLFDEPDLHSCNICGHVDRWTIEGRDNYKAFVCTHEPITATTGVGIRVVDSVNFKQVSWFEKLIEDED